MKKLLASILAIMLLAGCAPEVYDGPTDTVQVLTEFSTTGYGEYKTGGSFHQIETYSYDINGNRVRSCLYNEGKLVSERKQTFDDRGNCTREVHLEHFWIFSYPTSRTAYTYDDQNRLLSVTYRSGFGRKTGEETYTYDDEAHTVSWEGTYDSKTKYLNESGDPLRIITISKPSGMQIETLYEYDTQGRNTGVLEYRDGVLSTTSETRYDAQGRCIERTWREADGKLISRLSCQYTDNTVTTESETGDKTVEYLRPDGTIERTEHYAPDGTLTRVSHYTYTEIQIPAKEE